MFGLICGDVRYSGENVGTMGGGAFDTIAVIYATLTGFMVDVKVLKIVVKVDGASAEISA